MYLSGSLPSSCVLAFADAARDIEWPYGNGSRPGWSSQGPAPAAIGGQALLERPRQDRYVGELAVRRAVAAAVRCGDLGRVEVERHPGSAPRALVRDDAGRYAPADLSLSLSHCEGRAVAIAASSRMRVGVDLECVGRVGAGDERYFLTPRERRLRSRAYAELWALKEAAWKALALGPEVPFTDLELAFDRQGELRSVSVRSKQLSAGAVTSHPWPDFALAVVWLLAEGA